MWGQLGQTGMRLQLHDALDATSIVEVLATVPLNGEAGSEVIVNS